MNILAAPHSHGNCFKFLIVHLQYPTPPAVLPPAYPVPAAAAALLCPSMLLLALLLLASSTPAAAVAALNTNTSNPCAPALCGNLSIAYPFWLCPSMLLLALQLLASSTPAAAVAALNTNTSNTCAPALGGNLSIAYPFWLAGTHPPECGYKSFKVICDSQGNVSLANSFWRYRILDIFYPSNSFRAINIDLMSNDTCDLDVFFNASSDLGLSPFNISSKNQELFVLYSCDLGRRRVPPSWTRVVRSLLDGG
ncbi:hypothetical protein GQ55_5G470300 [Panicum hallii var. hallii]|uniref:Wall-associated receptor kinase galacturonan-binding domain-containing protein n=1 Tax=Panicum hallii var. hallii TaxID=1504633 RepID=A0A2T7DQT8_9POAL|nr:hypothetical protein GQ55_5G470300 [Panicum hallii var. hallii]